MLHGDAAMRLFEDTLLTPQLNSLGLAILDTTLVLFAFNVSR
jgi:hypothetical protein